MCRLDCANIIISQQWICMWGGGGEKRGEKRGEEKRFMLWVRFETSDWKEHLAKKKREGKTWSWNSNTYIEQHSTAKCPCFEIVLLPSFNRLLRRRFGISNRWCVKWERARLRGGLYTHIKCALLWISPKRHESQHRVKICKLHQQTGS